MKKEKLKLLVIYGTRPEAIKMAPVVHKLKELSCVQVKVCVTGQHREMLDQVNNFFEIIPDYDLDLMQERQSLNMLSARLFEGIERVLQEENPHWVLVHGDTTTSSISALAAFHRSIKVGHVEAGLRTYNKNSPFPEEINRQITSCIADMHFTPTASSRKNLVDENINESEILISGNTVIDALQIGLSKIDSGSTSRDLEYIKSIIQPNKRIIAVTGHRRENFGDGFEQLCKAIRIIAEKFNDVQLIYPVHLNPNVQEPVNRILSAVPNVNLVSPIDYPAFIYLMQMSYIILTDSGGVQEEAPSLGKPVLVMRDSTERPEAVQAKTVILTGTRTSRIVAETSFLLNNKVAYLEMSRSINPYGDGKAAERIANYFEGIYKQ